MLYKKSILFIFLVSVVLSCTLNTDDYEIKSLSANPNMAVPLAIGELSIQDILDQTDVTNLKVNSTTGVVSVIYQDTLDTRDIRDLIEIPDLATNHTLLLLPTSIPASASDKEFTFSTEQVDMGIGPEQLKEISFKSGILTHSMNLIPGSPNYPFKVKIRIPEFKKQNNTVFDEIVSSDGTFSLEGYTFKGTAANTFTLELTLIIDAHNAAYTVAPNTRVNVDVSMSGLDFNYVRGFFADQVANPSASTVSIGSFGDFLEEGTVTFKEGSPKISLTVINDYKVPLKVRFTNFQARNATGSLNVITAPSISLPVPINSPATEGGSATTVVSITNINELFAFKPTEFYYDVQGRINEGEISGNNFMADTSRMRVIMDVDLPLFGKASGITLLDTVDIDLDDLEGLEIESAKIKAIISNKLPLEANVQLYLLNADKVQIASLISTEQSTIVEASTVDSEGNLASPGLFNEMISLDQGQVNKLFEARYLVIETKLNTSKVSGNQVDVKFTSELKIDVKLGLEVKLKFKTDL